MSKRLSDEQLAGFATPRWVDNVASVPLDEMAVMIAEDPSVLTTLIGALRHARAECHGRRFDPNLVEQLRAAEKERDELRVAVAELEQQSKSLGDLAATKDTRIFELEQRLAEIRKGFAGEGDPAWRETWEAKR